MESRSKEKFEGIPPSRINLQAQESSSQQTLDSQREKELEHHHMHEGPSNPDPDPPSLLNNKATTQQVLLPQRFADTSHTTTLIRYRECLKNHAASTGGHVVDGCGEFMPGGKEGTPESLKCAACNCHRNFHRKGITFQTQNPPMLPPQHYRGAAPPPPPVRAPAESSSEDLNAGGGQGLMQVPSSKKRFRTKFTQQQKQQMHEFAEKIGWRIQKQDDEEVHKFCSEVGVKRQVFKVWMHNSKQAEKKKQM
ncbi:PREDICTED: zinc-finger homeodomain protein 2 [Ipomoea nil]|uniref:zinc-finger homeodomain protein 2 n=1 Tax=Ipomoea nil TaxID=35883 RepID=UPI0009010B9D|nr:PREDICTED: zinc-finger homeodomain protein 2 [Ipomoea nil]XP_019182449.1 PREDICTED: zinc-finger homeodomain protein 2 [Ipomoea nil]